MSYNEYTFPVDSKVLEKDGNRAQIEISPCYPGYGVTLGNSFRRVLLSSIPGGAVTAVKIEGAKHEFSAIEGIYQNMIDIILNIKKIRFNVATDEPVTLTLTAKGKKKVTAKDIQKDQGAEVINKDQFICELTEAKSEVEMTLIVEKGIGYSPIERREHDKKEIGLIEIDTLFSPMKNVSYEIKGTRLGKRTDYEKLIIDIETDGSLTPHDAFKQASLALGTSFAILANVKFEEIKKEATDIQEKNVTLKREKEEAEKDAEMEEPKEEKVVKREEDYNAYTLEKIGMPAKLINIFEKEGIKTVEDILKLKKDNLLEISGIGESSLKEVKKALGKHGITLTK